MEYDDEKTMVRSRLPPADTQGGVNVLPTGTQLAGFEIVDLIGESDFSIIYLAYDHALERHVALKEYMPSGMALRTRNLYVTIRAPHQADTFATGLRSFINEARLLAQFDSVSLVKVYRFWEANGTAYRVMPFYEGVTLKQALKECMIVPDEIWIKSLLSSLLDAVDTIHRVQCYHRAIAADNILLLHDGRPLLLDFGAARRVVADLTEGPAAILKPGFASIEQYADIPGWRQGSWTDVYALAAVVYYVMTGKTPPPATVRIVNDDMTPAREACRGSYSESFLAGIDQALAVKPEQRIQSVAELRRALDIGDGVSRTMPPLSAAQLPAARQGAETETTRLNTTKTFTAPHTRLSAPANAEEDWTKTMMSDKRRFEPASGRRRTGWLTLGLLLAAGIAGGAFWGLGHFAGSPSDPAAAALGTSNPADPRRETALAREERGGPGAEMAAATLRPNGAPDSAPPVAPPATAAPRLTPDDDLWRTSAASNRPGAYEAYLKQYPKGRHAATAKARLERMHSRNMLAKSGSAPTADVMAGAVPPVSPVSPVSPDDDLWHMAMTIDKPPAYESYLSRFPNGRHAEAAKAKLASTRLAESGASPAPSSARPTAPAPAPAERIASATGDKPEEPAGPAPAVTPKPPDAAVPEPATGGAKKVLKLANQTMTGDFAADPVTGRVTGKGRIDWTNGDRFEGTMVRGVKEGLGVFVWANGQRYSGQWANNQPNGKGTLIFANGNRYEGEVKDGLPHGDGATRFKSGDTHAGAYVVGQMQGPGRYIWANGSYWQGEFSNNRQTGNGKMVFSEKALEAARAAAGGTPMGKPQSSGDEGGNPERQAAGKE